MKTPTAGGDGAPPYEHTQRATMLIGILLGAGVPVLVASIFIVEMTEDDAFAGVTIAVGCLIVLVTAAWVFRSMTIRVADARLEWYFGSGIFRRSHPLAEILSAEPRKLSPIWGLGIHLTPWGWLYNVSGFSAVHVRLVSGKQFLLGTDEPDALAHAIDTARRAPLQH